jgi:hypothetical protein
MKTILRAFVVLIAIVFTGKLFAQSESAIEMLYLNPSPRLNGLGMLGTSYPNDDPAGFYYNPAQLGYISQTNNVSLQLYPSNVDWLGINLIKYRNTSFNIGYNFSTLLNGLNLSAGFGYINSEFDYNYSSSCDKFKAYGVGLGIDYFIQLNVGITYKKINSQMSGSLDDGKIVLSTANISALDYGLLLTVPISKLIESDLQFFILKNMPVFPYLNFSLGYAKLNIGDKVSYLDAAQADPLPRTARLGYTISTGLSVKLNNSILKAIEYDFTVDADDDLIKSEPVTYTKSYQGFLGDIKIGRNLIGLKSDDNVVVHKGHNIVFLETISFQIGRFDGRGYYNDKSSGLGIQTKGVFNILKTFTSNSILNMIVEHLDIQYYSTKLFVDSAFETKFKGINFVWYGMML